MTFDSLDFKMQLNPLLCGLQ